MVHFGRFVLSDHVTVILFFISLNFLLLSFVEAIIVALLPIVVVESAGESADVEAVAARDDLACVAWAEGEFAVIIFAVVIFFVSSVVAVIFAGAWPICGLS